MLWGGHGQFYKIRFEIDHENCSSLHERPQSFFYSFSIRTLKNIVIKAEYPPPFVVDALSQLLKWGNSFKFRNLQLRLFLGAIAML